MKPTLLSMSIGSGRKADRGNITYFTGSKLAPTTIRRRISALRSFYRWAIRLCHRHVPINPVRQGVRGQEHGLVSAPASVPWLPSERQRKASLQDVLTRLSVRDQAIVLLAHDGALRREEIVLLRFDDIDRRTHTIAVLAELTKNKMPGIIVLSHPTWTRLNDLHARLADLEVHIAMKRGKTDQRSASLHALLRERDKLQARLERQEKETRSVLGRGEAEKMTGGV